MTELYQLDEGFKTMKTMTRIIQLSVLLVATFSMSAAMACTAGAWNGGVTGNPAIAADPAPTEALPRVSGKCALSLTAAGTVMDTSPVVEPQAFIRFYVMGTPSSEVVIFEAFSDDAGTGGNELVTVSFDGTNFVFDAGSGASAPVAGKPGWNMIQLAWVGGTTMDYTLNAGTGVEQTGQVTAAAGTMESVILGASADPGGMLVFDDYEAHRETPVDGLLIGDSNNDGTVDIFDVASVLQEARFFGGVTQDGTPDCNMDGTVDIFDVAATLQAARFFGAVPCNSN